MTSPQNNWIKEIDERSRLAGTNRLEILLFSLGDKNGKTETFGLNVFKVREVMKTPEITSAPDMPKSVKGLVSLRGILVPVIDLAEYCGASPDSERQILIVTEYNAHQQGFLVESVERIVRLDWSKMKLPPEMLSGNDSGLLTAVTELDDGRLAMILDVEKILSDVTGYDGDAMFSTIETLPSVEKEKLSSKLIVFTDDSDVARKQVARTLDMMGLPHIGFRNGKQAAEYFDKLATSLRGQNKKPSDLVPLLLTDAEMPEMDGYTLVKFMKSNPLLSDIKVLVHSSLSNENTMKLSSSVGADMHVSKLNPAALSGAIKKLLDLP